MDQQRLVKVSKYLAKHLRHCPERLGLRLDSGGWVCVDELLPAAEQVGVSWQIPGKAILDNAIPHVRLGA